MDSDFLNDSTNLTTILLGGSVTYNRKIIKLTGKEWIETGIASAVANFCALSLKLYNKALFKDMNGNYEDMPTEENAQENAPNATFNNTHNTSQNQEYQANIMYPREKEENLFNILHHKSQSSEMNMAVSHTYRDKG